MTRKRWQPWHLQLNSEVQISRLDNGKLQVGVGFGGTRFGYLFPRETRRLFQKLSGDFRD